MNTPIAQLLSRKGSTLYAVTVSATVAEAVHEMNKFKIGSIVVMQADRLAGIFTERDVLTRVIAANRDPHTTPISEVMTSPPITISPRMTIEEAMRIVTEQRCRHLPVIEDGSEAVLGMISIGDITRWLVDAHRMEADHLRTYIAGGYAT